MVCIICALKLLQCDLVAAFIFIIKSWEKIILLWKKMLYSTWIKLLLRNSYSDCIQCCSIFLHRIYKKTINLTSYIL